VSSAVLCPADIVTNHQTQYNPAAPQCVCGSGRPTESRRCVSGRSRGFFPDPIRSADASSQTRLGRPTLPPGRGVTRFGRPTLPPGRGVTCGTLRGTVGRRIGSQCVPVEIVGRPHRSQRVRVEIVGRPNQVTVCRSVGRPHRSQRVRVPGLVGRRFHPITVTRFGRPTLPPGRGVTCGSVGRRFPPGLVGRRFPPGLVGRRFHPITVTRFGRPTLSPDHCDPIRSADAFTRSL
jgi:hypothetical protein